MTPEQHTLFDYFGLLNETLAQFNHRSALVLVDDLWTCYREGRMVFVCGNGGSGANASHLCEDLGKSLLDRDEFLREVPRLKILSLTDNTAYILAWANDEGFERVFVEQLKNLASPGDRLLAISGSGNSKNVLEAVHWANRHGLTTWGITGFDGGELTRLAQHPLHVPVHNMGLTESIHLLLFHWVLDELHRRLHAPVQAA